MKAKRVRFIFAVAVLAAMIAGAGSSVALAIEGSPTNPLPASKVSNATVLAEKATASKTNADAKGRRVMLKGYDPVAYFKQHQPVRGLPSISSSFQGVTYFFASKSDKTAFDRNPPQYVPQYGGFCADSMSKGRLKDINPNVFYIYKNRLYLCSSPAAEKEFMKNPDVNISKADKNYQKIGERTFNTETGGFERPWPFGPESSQQ